MSVVSSGRAARQNVFHFAGALGNPEGVSQYLFGAHGVRETPVPMPNTEVKPRCGYNTWVIKPWENSTVPNYIESLRKEAFYFVEKWPLGMFAIY